MFGSSSTLGGTTNTLGGNGLFGGGGMLGGSTGLGGAGFGGMGNKGLGGLGGGGVGMAGGLNAARSMGMGMGGMLPTMGGRNNSALALEHNIQILKHRERAAQKKGLNGEMNKYLLNQSRMGNTRRLQANQQQARSPIRPRSVGGAHYVAKNVSQSLFDDTQINQVLSPDMFRRRSAKHLTIEDDDEEDSNSSRPLLLPDNGASTNANSPYSPGINVSNQNLNSSRASFVPSPSSMVNTPSLHGKQQSNNKNAFDNTNNSGETKGNENKNSNNGNIRSEDSNDKVVPSSNPPKLKNPHLSTNPSIEALSKMSDVQLSAIKGFEIIHSEHGSIKWIGKVDLRGLDLDKIVHIGQGSIFVYHDDESPVQLQSLPKTGEGLNNRAILTMNNIFPESEDDDLQDYEESLKKYNEELGFYI